MKKIRMWCDGGRRPLQGAQGSRSKHVRCAVCGQRFLPSEARSAEGQPTGFIIPPHKAY